MRLLITAAALLALAASPARAETIAVGTVVDGYTFNGSYWAYGDKLYTRAWVPGYQSYDPYRRCYVSTAGYYTYALYTPPAPAVTVNVAAAPPVYTKDWKVETFKFLNDREDRALYAETLKALGYSSLNVGASFPGVSSYGVTTGTFYGTSLRELAADFYGDKNLALLLQGAVQSTDTAQRLSGQAQTDLLDLTRLTAQQRGRIAEILARARAIEPSPSATIEQRQFNVGGFEPDGPPAAPAFAPRAAKSLRERWVASAGRCFECHNRDKKDGGFDVAAFPSLDLARGKAVIDRLQRPESDPKHMPKGGPMLPEDEILVWIQVLFAGQQPAGPARREELPLPKRK